MQRVTMYVAIGSHIPVLAGFPSANAPPRVSFHGLRLLLSEFAYNKNVVQRQREFVTEGEKRFIRPLCFVRATTNVS
jgi:hypothetical protein